MSVLVLLGYKTVSVYQAAIASRPSPSPALPRPSALLSGRKAERAWSGMHRCSPSVAVLILACWPAFILGSETNEVCPAAASESQLCQASQDFIFVIDNSFSRLDYVSEFKEFLTKMVAELGLDAAQAGGPRVSIVYFEGADSDPEWTDEESTTTALALSDDPNAVANAINSLPDPESSCSATGGCTCISCGINIAWGLVPDDQKTGRDGGQPPTLLVLTDGCALRPACADLAPPSHQSPPCPDAAFKMSTEDKQQQMQPRPRSRPRVAASSCSALAWRSPARTIGIAQVPGALANCIRAP